MSSRLLPVLEALALACPGVTVPSASERAVWRPLPGGQRDEWSRRAQSPPAPHLLAEACLLSRVPRALWLPLSNEGLAGGSAGSVVGA